MRNKSLRALAIIACTLPCIANAAGDCFEIGLTGGWFSAFPDGRVYGATSPSNVAGTSLNGGALDQVEPKYKFGGGINLTYQSCNDPFYWNLSWFGINRKNTTDSDGPFVLNGRLPTLTRVGSTFANSASSTLSMRYQFAAATVGIVKGICDDAFLIKPHIGVGYLNEREQQTTVYNNINGGVNSATVVDNSKFNGLGPTIGADLKYNFCGDFTLMGSFDYSALVGRQKGFYSLTAPAAVGGTSSIPFSNARANAFVNHIQSELGLGYSLNCLGFGRGDIILGWRFVNMTDVSRRITPLDGSINNQFFNATVHGPFLRLNWGFNL